LIPEKKKKLRPDGWGKADFREEKNRAHPWVWGQGSLTRPQGPGTGSKTREEIVLAPKKAENNPFFKQKGGGLLTKKKGFETHVLHDWPPKP